MTDEELEACHSCRIWSLPGQATSRFKMGETAIAIWAVIEFSTP